MDPGPVAAVLGKVRRILGDRVGGEVRESRAEAFRKSHRWRSVLCPAERCKRVWYTGDMEHSSRFDRLCEAARQNITEISLDDVHARLERGESFALVDVREESEFAAGHLPNAKAMGRGILERDIERTYPDLGTELVLYCGGGFRSALSAESLQKMGYTNVKSMAGGWRGWKEKGYPTTK